VIKTTGCARVGYNGVMPTNPYQPPATEKSRELTSNSVLWKKPVGTVAVILFILGIPLLPPFNSGAGDTEQWWLNVGAVCELLALGLGIAAFSTKRAKIAVIGVGILAAFFLLALVVIVWSHGRWWHFG
jgi:hypothetical protein